MIRCIECTIEKCHSDKDSDNTDRAPCYYRADVDLLYVSLHGAWLGRMAGRCTAKARLTPPIPALLKDKEN